jgi:hypothetical protein
MLLRGFKRIPRSSAINAVKQPVGLKQNVAFLSSKVDNFLSGSNAVYVDQMFDAWKKDPSRYSNIIYIYIYI